MHSKVYDDNIRFNLTTGGTTSERMIITPAGNVTIGGNTDGTAPAWSSDCLLYTSPSPRD